MRYKNPHVGNIRRRLFDVLLWKTGYFGHAEHLKSMPKSFSYPKKKSSLSKAKPLVTWIGHCTFLVQIYGLNILTDPVFGERCSPLPFLGPIRRHAPGIPLEQLPPIDIVLISHNHYDHLEKKTVLDLSERFPKIQWIVPEGVAPWFKKCGVKRVKELKWWQELSFKKKKTNTKITAVPTQHFSGRFPLDFNRSLWAGFVVEVQNDKKQKKRLYFTGDTGYNKVDFKQIGEKFHKMDLSLIPIGTYEPLIFMRPVHVGPKDAVKIHQEVHSKLSVGMHWKTFNLSDEPLERPPYDLYRAMKHAKLDPSTFIPLQPGESINW
ncbi:MAG: MBL fold metallo-hydrolase [Chlamydiales bacterium]|nr:MBL fold metallo-hydrolase [Chlamydiales bacterium]